MNQDNNLNNNAQGNNGYTGPIPTVANPGDATQQIPVVSNPALEQTTQLPIVSNPTDIPIVSDPTTISSSPVTPSQNEVVIPSSVNQTSNTEVVPRTGDILTTSTVKLESTEIHPQPAADSEKIVSEKLKKVEIDYKPPSRFKLFLMSLFFVLIIGFVIFLPDIQQRIREIKNKPVEIEKITNGKLECVLNTNSYNLDVNYQRIFRMTDNKLTKTEFVIETKGDSNEDAETLQNTYDTCQTLAEYSNTKIPGVNIRCVSEIGKVTESQSFDLSVVDMAELKAAFIETGGIFPEYYYDEDMDMIERNMKASNYTCERVN